MMFTVVLTFLSVTREIQSGEVGVKKRGKLLNDSFKNQQEELRQEESRQEDN